MGTSREQMPVEDAIREHIDGSYLRHYLSAKHKWTDLTWSSIDWYSHERNLKVLKGTCLFQRLKFIHDWQPTNSNKLPQTPTNSHQLPSTPINSHKLPQTPTNSHKLPQTPTNSHKLPQTPTNSHKLPQTQAREVRRCLDRPLPMLYGNSGRPRSRSPMSLSSEHAICGAARYSQLH